MDYRDRKPHKCKRRYQPELIPCQEPYLQYVIHEHDTWKYHFDFRFELGGALRDFVVPAGPSTDPSKRRYAFSYHDHDLRCLKLEHGGDGHQGAMLLWDRGLIRPCFPHAASQEEAIWIGLEQGRFEFELYGEKLKGKWMLVAEGADWALQKMGDEYASTDNILRLNRSIVSGKTLAELYAQQPRRAVILWLSLLEFYIPDRMVQHPVLITRDGIILDRNQAAKAKNVHPGLELKKAKAILHDAEFIPWEAEAYHAKQAEWLDICMQFSNVIEPADQHQAWVDLSMHPDPVGTAKELVLNVQKQTNLTVQSGIATTKWIAQLAARYESIGNVALPTAKDFVANLPIRELLPVSAEMRERLSFLGYDKIGKVAEIPFEALKEQFGTESYVIASAAKGEVYQPVEALYPPESCLETFAFDGLAESTEVIQNGVVELAMRIGRRLEAQCLEGTKVSITLEYEDSRTRTLQRVFSKPIRDSRSALAGISLLLEKELHKPLLSLRVLIRELRKVQVVQGAFLEARGERIPRRLTAAVQRARTVYGDQSVKRGQEIQLPRRVLVLREWKSATGWQ